MQFATFDDLTLHYRFRPGTGAPIVLLNSLGTDLRIWDAVVARLDPSLPVLRMDKRGHGLSDDGPISMTLLISDAARLMDHLGLSGALICGVSVGGMIAQGLAATRPDLAAGLVLCCTGARIGDAASWNARIDTVRQSGIASMSDAILERWFSPDFRANRLAELAGYRNMLTRTSPDGYAGVCAAIRDTDFREQSKSLKQPSFCIAGADDMATPVDLVRDLAGRIDGAGFEVIAPCGHLPCIETPDRVAAAVQRIHADLP